MRSARWFWLTGTILALGLMGAVGLVVRAHLAIRARRAGGSRRAGGRSARLGRRPACPLAARQPSSAEAHALKAESRWPEGDFPEVKREFNEARSLGYPRKDLDRIQAIWASRLGQFAQAEPILTTLFDQLGEAGPRRR